MEKPEGQKKLAERKLGDEWLDWDGKADNESSETPYRLFLGLAVLATIVLILAAGLFLWLIYPRLTLLGDLFPKLFSIIFFLFSGALILWMVLFAWSAATRRPVPRLFAMPRLINRLLSIVITLAKILGISRDRLTNSFLKIHNVIIGSRPRKVASDRLLVLSPRCLTRENNKILRELRDRYGFRMAIVGGGSEARVKIREFRPEIVVAIACERDLLSGFREVNPYIPVIGFPNQRPEGPCKNTCIDLSMIEETIRNCLHRQDDRTG